MTFDSMKLQELATRRMVYAIVASGAVHILMFWPAYMRVPTEDSASQLQATLLAAPPVPAVPAPPTPPTPAMTRKPPTPAAARSPVFRQPKSAAEPPAPTVAPITRRVTDPTLERARPSMAPQAMAVSDGPILKPSLTLALAPQAAAKAPAVASGPAIGGVLTESSATGEAAEGLRGYRIAVAAQARRFKRYPAQAMAAGWVGSADIRVEVGIDGLPWPATVVRSSGYQVLDRAAVAMIDGASVRARLPDSLRGKAFAVVLPVVFNLEDE